MSLSTEILSIVLSGVIAPIIGLIVWLFKRRHQEKVEANKRIEQAKKEADAKIEKVNQYKILVTEWANKSLGTMRSIIKIISDDNVKMIPPIKSEIINSLNELVEEEKQIRKSMV